MFRKNVLKTLTMFVFVLCMCMSLSVSSYAFEGETAPIQIEDDWVRNRLGNSEMVNYTNDWRIESGFNGLYIYEKDDGFDAESKIEFTFEGTAFRLLGYDVVRQNSKYRIKIDDIVDEIVTYENDGRRVNASPIVFQKLNLEDKEHTVTITPVSYYEGGKSGSHRLYAVDIYIGEVIEENIILDIEPQKEKIQIDEEVIADLTINNIEKITAEDIRIKYDSSKLEYLGYEEVEGIKLIKDIQNDDEIRVILASQGEANIINAKEVLLRLKFRGIASGQAIVDVTKGRVTDGIEMEKDLEDSECGKGIILIEEQEGFIDVNNSGEFTLLDLGIDARHLNKDPNSVELSEYNTDIIEDGSINDMDLLEIGKLMLENGNYTPNNY
ncbi:cohesin domain-containing protein [Peptostreptococcaceae bacterium AGR-M142]